MRETVELAENTGWDSRVLVVHCAPIVDAYIIVCEQFIVILDTLINARTAQALLGVARKYLRSGKRLLVINSHADWDHCWGNQIFSGHVSQYPAPIIASQRCGRFFDDPQGLEKLARMKAQSPERFSDVRLTAPTLLFENRLILHGGDLSLELIPTPGHTADHIAVFIPEISLLLAGDAAEPPYPCARTGAQLPELRHSLRLMADLKPQWALYSHAPVDSGPALLNDNLAYFDHLEACCRRALDNGMPYPLPEDESAARYVDCTYEQAIPERLCTQNYPEWYRKEGHEEQVRMMLDWLAKART